MKLHSNAKSDGKAESTRSGGSACEAKSALARAGATANAECPVHYQINSNRTNKNGGIRHF
ncbi:hypothetical protein [Acidovorax sp. SUPP3334]|uniref:hypothetical protein n=1 Tax=Acidovorax sp. SUPP3334 TaxID=2920881 RepID=UPI0024E15959|nr:hypothetical protein [Acidovorax sp. SUPP3334]